MQSDGNLVLYRTQFDRALWASHTESTSVNRTIMQADRNLVVYAATGTSYLATGTEGHPGAWAVLQDDGSFVIYDPDSNALWASNTVHDSNLSTFQYVDPLGYKYDETLENWKQLCTADNRWPTSGDSVVERQMPERYRIFQAALARKFACIIACRDEPGRTWRFFLLSSKRCSRRSLSRASLI
jgi:hypothetical protein